MQEPNDRESGGSFLISWESVPVILKALRQDTHPHEDGICRRTRNMGFGRVDFFEKNYRNCIFPIITGTAETLKHLFRCDIINYYTDKASFTTTERGRKIWTDRSEGFGWSTDLI